MAEKTDISELSFEIALKELEEIVAKLESGQADLDASIDLYERGEQLKQHCEGLLKKAESRIEKITLSADGNPEGVTPLEAE